MPMFAQVVCTGIKRRFVRKVKGPMDCVRLASDMINQASRLTDRQALLEEKPWRRFQACVIYAQKSELLLWTIAPIVRTGTDLKTFVLTLINYTPWQGSGA